MVILQRDFVYGPEYFAGTQGMNMVNEIVDLMQLQIETQINKWYRFVPGTISAFNGYIEYFDIGRSEGDEYCKLVRGIRCDVIKVAMAEPDFADPHWQPHQVNRVVTLVMQFFFRGRLTGFRLVMVHIDGSIEEVVDFGAVDGLKLTTELSPHQMITRMERYVPTTHD